jgi:DNA-directed RNA polymerase subunit F
MVTTRKQIPTEARTAALRSEYAPLYAVAGLTDALTEVFKGALAETQERTGETLSMLQRRSVVAGKQARENVEELRTLVITLPDQVKNLPEATRARIVDLQRDANELMAQASTTYGQLAGRGKRAVDDAMADVAERVDPAFERVQETVTQARKATTGRTATQTMVPRSVAKAVATRKAAAKKAPAKKAPARKAPTKK